MKKSLYIIALSLVLFSCKESKTEEVINYIKTCQEKLSVNTNLEESYKKLTKMVNAIEK